MAFDKMEILMKPKCSPATPATAKASTLSALKVIDHHHQLQQHTLLRPPSAATFPRTPPTMIPTAPPPTGAPQEPTLLLPNSRLQYNSRTTPMNCCSAAAQQDMFLDLQWQQRNNGRVGAGGGGGDSVSSSIMRNMHALSALDCGSVCNSNYCRASYEALPTPSCCASINYGMTTPPLPSQPPQPPQSPRARNPSLHVERVASTATTAVEDCNAHYEYHEPEENFVSIDDAKIKGLLLQIGREREAQKKENVQGRKSVERLETHQQKADAKKTGPVQSAQVVFEIIDLDDEEEREKLQRIKVQVEKRLAAQQQQQKALSPSKEPATPTPPRTCFPSISLIPKVVETKNPPSVAANTSTNKKENIIAQIELLDSSSSSSSSESETEEQTTAQVADDVGDGDTEDCDDDDDDEELPFAAAAVSCELDCDEEDSEEVSNENAKPEVVILASDDEDNADFIEQHEEGLELRWDDLECQRERTFYECFLCGKKVQSSYNLRRHMMIHTGERPFGCDLCVRRFREFSDLKKHRRRHVGEANFFCMVCRINPPMEHDPTRCKTCDCKSGLLMAATQITQTAASVVSGKQVASSPPAAAVLSRTSSPAVTLQEQCSTTVKRPKLTLPTSPPPLTPINSASIAIGHTNFTASNLVVKHIEDTAVTACVAAAEAQQLLDNIPAVHRPSYGAQAGVVVTRREFPCPLCQRPFGTRHNLKRHFMIHTGEKPFNCLKCRKPFREYSTLKKHMVTHQRDRWYKCLRCPRRYRDYLDYMAHKDTHPKDTLLGVNVQSESGSNSPQSSPSKKLHRSNDSFDSNDDDSLTADHASLECCECGERYSELDAYTEHLKLHDSTLFLYECYICKQQFSTHEKLLQHLQNKHNAEPTEDEDDKEEDDEEDEEDGQQKDNSS